MLRRFRDGISTTNSSSSNSSNSSSNSSSSASLMDSASSPGRKSPSPLRRSSRDLITGLGQLSEEGEDEDEEDDASLKADVRKQLTSADSVKEMRDKKNTIPKKPSTVGIIDSTHKITDKPNNNHERSRQMALVVISILFILVGLVLFQMGITSITEFRRRLLRPFVLQVATWLSDVS
jgi:hypothetical protein